MNKNDNKIIVNRETNQPVSRPYNTTQFRSLNFYVLLHLTLTPRRSRHPRILWCCCPSDSFDLPKVLKHKAQRARSVRHRVGAMQDNERIIQLVIGFNVRRNSDPVRHGHIARIQQRVVFQN